MRNCWPMRNAASSRSWDPSANGLGIDAAKLRDLLNREEFLTMGGRLRHYLLPPERPGFGVTPVGPSVPASLAFALSHSRQRRVRASGRDQLLLASLGRFRSCSFLVMQVGRTSREPVVASNGPTETWYWGNASAKYANQCGDFFFRKFGFHGGRRCFSGVFQWGMSIELSRLNTCRDDTLSPRAAKTVRQSKKKGP
jgi:hypothetical protein